MSFFSYLKKFIDDIKFNFLPSQKHVNLNRVYVVLIFFIFCYFIISVRLFDLTILKGLSGSEFEGEFDNRAAVTFKRGNIVDRNGKLLAVNLVTTSIYANPQVIKDKAGVVRILSRIFPDIDKKSLSEKLQSEKSFVWIKRNISPREESLLNNEGIPGVYFRFGKRRVYPQGSLFSHVVGYVGLDGDGLLGAEKYFDKFLKSKDSHKNLRNLQLSLEVRAQGIIREELQETVKEFNAKGAIGILQDVKNGEIISLVSLPDYNPNNISEATEEELFNKATLGNYEIGSGFKVFTVSAALESGIVKVNDVYDVDTPIKSSGFLIKDFSPKKGWLSVPEILMYSSNIGVAQIAVEIGKENQFGHIKALGLLSSIDVELPETTTPVFPDIGRWTEITSIAASYGYGISISPLHVTKAAGAIVNGGKLFSPTIVKGANKPYKQVLKESTSDSMRKILRMVVRQGSGRTADVPGVFVGGKTGTANKPVKGVYDGSLRVSSFMSFFPAHDPKYVMYIMLDEPKASKKSFGFATGGWVGAPVSGRIIKRLVPLMDIMPNKDEKGAIEESLFLNYTPKGETS